MLLEKLDEPFKMTNLLPPTLLFENGKDSPEGVSTVRASASIAGKSSVLYDDENSPSVI